MSHNLLLAITFVTALGSGLMAGLFFVFSVAVMRALARIPAPSGIAAMQAINVVILNPIFGLVFFGTTAASALLAAYAFFVTVAFNVPRNNALAAVDPASAEGARVWSDYRVTWTTWNHVRTLSSLVATAAFIVAFCLLRDSRLP